MSHIRPRLFAAFISVACLALMPREAVSCSCVDWSRVGAGPAREAFLDDWTRAEAAVSGTVVEASDLKTVVRVRQTLKGQTPGVLHVFPRPVQSQAKNQGDRLVIEGGMDCRPVLKQNIEYLILLFRTTKGRLDAERCAVWTGVERKERLDWIPRSR